MKNIERELLKYYYEKVNEDSPKAIENLDFVNRITVYLFEIYNNFDMTGKDLYNKSYLSKKDINFICMDVLKSLDIKYLFIFKRCINDHLIVSSRRDYSYTNNNGMGVIRTNNLEEVLATLHEFGHYIHLLNSDSKIDAPDFWHFTETIAMTFEFYALFYMQKNGISDEEARKSFLLYIETLYVFSYNIIGEALALNIINKYGDLRGKDVKAYKDEYGINNYYIKYLNNIDLGHLLTGKKYRYVEDYRNLYGFPLAIYMANRMVNSYSYKERFIENFSNIKELGSDKFLKKMSAYRIIEDPGCLEWVMANIYSYTQHIVYEDTFNPKTIKFKR